MKRLSIKCVLCALLVHAGVFTAFAQLPPPPQAPIWLGDWYPSVELQLTYDDNINRSFDGDGEKSDIILEPSVRFERQQPLSDDMFAHYAVTIDAAVHADYTKLNYLAPGVDIGVRQQMGTQPNASAWIASLRLNYEFHNQDFRFGAVANPRIEGRFGVGAASTVSVYYEYDNRFASDNPVYDRDGHTLGFAGDIPLNKQTAIVLVYSYRRGDVLVHQPREDLGEEIRGERYPLNTFKTRYDAVNISDADTHFVYAGVNHALSLYTSLNAGLAYEQIRADGDTYPSMQIRLGVSHLL